MTAKRGLVAQLASGHPLAGDVFRSWVCPFVLGELWRANWARQRGFSLSWGRGGCSGRPNARCPGLGNGTVCVRTSVFELARRMAAVASQRLRKSGDIARCSARAPSARSFDSRAVGCSIGLRGLILLPPRGWIIAGALRCRGARCLRFKRDPVRLTQNQKIWFR